MNAKATLDIATAVFAFIAAVLWLRSATIKFPRKITTGFGGSGGSAQLFADAVRRGSQWSAAAAAAAAVAAFLQGVSALIGG